MGLKGGTDGRIVEGRLANIDFINEDDDCRLFFLFRKERRRGGGKEYY